MRTSLLHVLTLITAVVLAAPLAAEEAGKPAPKPEIDCSKCHASLTVRLKVVHPAIQMGCPACHSGIDDALKVPHKKTTTAPKGLSAEQPDLCYGCHDKAKFTLKVVHGAIGMGCTSCHNPHASNNEKLFPATVPELCFMCHDKAGFTHKNVHPPVESGMCLSCHNPHSSDQQGLLLKPTHEVCLECHDHVTKTPHAISGFSKTGHPLGIPKKGKDRKPVMDPKREGKLFTCAGCHNPHSSDSPRLYRYPAKSPMELCAHCHNK
jgi:predicted CXXCH cytochrome family protein